MNEKPIPTELISTSLTFNIQKPIMNIDDMIYPISCGIYSTSFASYLPSSSKHYPKLAMLPRQMFAYDIPILKRHNILIWYKENCPPKNCPDEFPPMKQPPGILPPGESLEYSVPKHSVSMKMEYSVLK